MDISEEITDDEDFLELINIVYVPRNHALTPDDMVFVTLRYLATGSFLQVIGDVQGTASRVVVKVMKSLAVHFRELIKMPENGEKRTVIRQEFVNIARFPRCIGALDCTHYKIKSPGGANPENYRKRFLFL
ncbi:unnamed protein product [Acanthoscelides obtectus]|uniref:Nuclease HARBI1 n=1 Tax=Acanthoscelides obtectus TaxID=200917 RepID=A0A9P0QIE7_ACAOB|nr:unnamed protein product [Acanthoscelides obtectus]CAK1655539.1 Putative nuclease HARBI1 [Acanthoscelides obtectus]